MQGRTRRKSPVLRARHDRRVHHTEAVDGSGGARHRPAAAKVSPSDGSVAPRSLLTQEKYAHPGRVAADGVDLTFFFVGEIFLRIVNEVHRCLVTCVTALNRGEV